MQTEKLEKMKMDLRRGLDSIIKAAENQPISENQMPYLGEDGLLYCSICNERIETNIEIFGIEKKVRCICKCEQDKMRELDEKREQEKKAKLIKNLRRSGFHDEKFKQCTFEASKLDNRAINVGKRYAKNFEEIKEKGHGILLFGDVGVGKTFVAACIVNSVIDQGYSAIMTNFSRIINTVQETFDQRQKYLDSLNSVDLMVIDDLAVERKTDYVKEMMYQIIDNRYRSGKPLIVTTNLTIDNLVNATDISDKRTYHRILEMCTPLKVEGENLRTKQFVHKRNVDKNEM